MDPRRVGRGVARALGGAPRLSFAIGLLAASTSLLVLVSTGKYGAGLTPDSIAYLSTAASLATGGGFAQFDGTPYLHWPPLFPILLAAFGVAGVTPATAARLLNALCAGLTVVLTCVWLSKRVRPPLVAVAGLSVALSPPLLYSARFALTETTFNLLLLLFLTTLAGYLATGRPAVLYAATAVAAAAALTRFIGVSAALTGALFLLARPRHPGRRWRDVAILVAGSALPVAAWMVRSRHVSGTTTGERGAPSETIGANLARSVEIVTGWVFPRVDELTVLPGFEHIQMALAWRLRERVLPIEEAATLAGLVALAVYCVRSRRGKVAAHDAASETVPAVQLFGIFSLVYWAMLLALAATTRFDAINERLLGPVCVPLFLLIVMVFERVAQQRPATTRGWAARAAVVVFSLWVTGAAALRADDVYAAGRRGAGGFATDAWQTASIWRFVRDHALPGPVYSNDPAAYYAATTRPAGWLPRQPGAPAAGRTGDEELVRASQIHIVWFGQVSRRYPWGLDSVSALLAVEPFWTGPDGAVYRAVKPPR